LVELKNEHSWNIAELEDYMQVSAFFTVLEAPYFVELQVV